MTTEEARNDGKFVKVPIPAGNESTYAKVFREQSEEIQRKIKGRRRRRLSDESGWSFKPL